MKQLILSTRSPPSYQFLSLINPPTQILSCTNTQKRQIQMACEQLMYCIDRSGLHVLFVHIKDEILKWRMNFDSPTVK